MSYNSIAFCLGKEMSCGISEKEGIWRLVLTETEEWICHFQCTRSAILKANDATVSLKLHITESL